MRMMRQLLRRPVISILVLMLVCQLALGSLAGAGQQDVSAEESGAEEQRLNFCVMCKKSSRFRPYGFGEHQRVRARCPNCKSLERHRLLYLYLEQNWPDLFRNATSLLHFAPNDSLEKILRSKPGLRYLTADLFRPADLKLDLTAIDLPDESFDAVICYHVLEHVEEDRRAMAEIFRILKPDGWALIQVPVYRDRPDTVEDPSILTPEERTTHYGSPSHLRQYGWRDLEDQLEQVGFDVRIERVEHIVDPSLFKKYGLDENELVYFCGKPASSDTK